VVTHAGALAAELAVARRGAASYEALFPDAGVGRWRLAVRSPAAHRLLAD